MSRPHRRPRARAAAVLATALILSGCAATATPVAPRAGRSGDARGEERAIDGAATALPSAHVHGIAVNPADGRIYLASHDGLFRYDDTGPVRVGPVIDLMGFTVAGPDHFYASGHPGPGTDLPEPVGLIESRDGGQTWTPLSRQGDSDFHALTASAAGVVGYDGTALRTTSDGTTWRDLDPPAAPYALTASPDGAVLLVTTESGPLRSADAGATWARVTGAPLLQVVDWADGSTAVGVTPDGRVAVTDDAGATWTERGAVAGPPQAMSAFSAPGGSRVLVVTAGGIQESVDGGATFAPLPAS